MTYRMIAAATALLGLAACEAPMPAKGEFVPYAQVLAENRALPFSCTDYDAASQTCEGVDRPVLSGNRWRSTGVIAADFDGLVAPLTLQAKGTIRDGRQCLDGKDVRVSFGQSLGGASAGQVEELFRAIFALLGEVCSSYYRAGDGVYFVETTRPDGTALPDSHVIVRFFAEQPDIRPISN